MNILAGVQQTVRRLTQMVFGRFSRSRTSYGVMGERSYEPYVGDGRGSPIVMSCISWIVNAFTAMRPVVVRLRDDDLTVGEQISGHAMARLFRRPTFDPRTERSAFTWMTLIAGVLVSFIIDGNAYLLKVRGAGGVGRPVQLWYIPHWLIQPVWDPSDPTTFIAYYDYCPDGTTHYRIDVGDIVHLRDGIDPENTRKGLSKTKVLLREVMTDEQAARWTVSLLMNHAVPGLVFAPELPLEDPSDASKVKADINQQFTGDGRGSTIVLSGPTKVMPFGFSPEQMKLGDIRDIPEERITMALGIPAAVVGAGAGLQSTKVGATMAELVDLAWQNGVMPRANIIAAELTEQLLTDFGSVDDVEFILDTSRVPIMADYHLKVAQTHEVLMKNLIETRAEARRALGQSTTDDDDVYILQAGVTLVNPDGTPQVEPPEPTAAALGPGGDQLMLGPGEPRPMNARQAKIAGLLDAGKTQKEIAADLDVSERTVQREAAFIRQWREVAAASSRKAA